MYMSTHMFYYTSQDPGSKVAKLAELGSSQHRSYHGSDSCPQGGEASLSVSTVTTLPPVKFHQMLEAGRRDVYLDSDLDLRGGCCGHGSFYYLTKHCDPAVYASGVLFGQAGPTGVESLWAICRDEQSDSSAQATNVNHRCCWHCA